jgi:hypothetical protein
VKLVPFPIVLDAKVFQLPIKPSANNISTTALKRRASQNLPYA